MSLRSGKSYVKRSEHTPPRPSTSIANQLTAHFMMSAFVIFSCAMVLLYLGIDASLRKQTTSYMNDEVLIIQKLVTTNQIEGLKRKIIFSSQKEYEKLFIRLLDKNGVTTLETPEMTTKFPVSLFSPPSPVESYHGDYVKRTIGNRVYFLKSLWLHVLGEPKMIQVALDATNLKLILAEYSRKIILVLLGGILLSTLAGRFITRRALKPIEKITERSKAITVSNLDDRLMPDEWPAELYELAIGLNEMLDRLHESFERMRGYAANLAHELRTPINNLMGEAELALTRPRSIEEYGNVIESSLEEYQRLSRIIDSLLFLAWADSRQLKLTLSTFNICRELINLKDYYAPNQLDIEFELHCDPSLTMVADVSLFRRAVGNLMLNAIKYCQCDCTIVVDVQQTATSLEISVSDNGPGIAPEHLDHLFDRFYRVQDGMLTKHKGSGLGLSLVKSIMDLHMGYVEVVSNINVGSKFTLVFPTNTYTN